MLLQITVPLRHVVPLGLIRSMCVIFGATKSRVAQSFVYEYYRAKVHQVGSIQKRSWREGMLLQYYCTLEACCVHTTD